MWKKEINKFLNFVQFPLKFLGNKEKNKTHTSRIIDVCIIYDQAFSTKCELEFNGKDYLTPTTLSIQSVTKTSKKKRSLIQPYHQEWPCPYLHNLRKDNCE